RFSAFCMYTCTQPQHAYLPSIFMLTLHWKPVRSPALFHAHLALDNSAGARHVASMATHNAKVRKAVFPPLCN
ncbi:MAG TPA: hypothetical protein VKV17_05880, partial [Bryobacteraceae bacterium]|nr:hypothetical protein [Bryobacteraceae bacterium]